MLSDAAAGAETGSSPPPSAPMFSKPGAVKLPTFPDRMCPVAAGTSTAAINAAIASCSGMGGGVVSFAPGTYTVGIDPPEEQRQVATGRGHAADRRRHRPARALHRAHPLPGRRTQRLAQRHVLGENLTNVAIVGPGTLDGVGLDGEFQKMIAIKSSTGLLFDNLTQRNTGHFGYLLTDCHHITLSRLTIRPTRDGVNLMECTNVNAHDLQITGGPDDG